MKVMEPEKEQAIQKLIDVFARDFPRRNHIILVDMSSGSYRVDEMLVQEIRTRETVQPSLPEIYHGPDLSSSKKSRFSQQ
jgi:hypothetical protein